MTFIIDMASGQHYDSKPRQLNAGENELHQRHVEQPDLQLALVETGVSAEPAGVVPASLDMRKMFESMD